MIKYSPLALLWLPMLAHADALGIPKTSGFSGSVMGGVNIIDYSSNYLKGPKGDETLASLTQEAERQSVTKELLGGDFRYTFAESGTQIILGNLIQDAVRFDFTQQLGVRQQLEGNGIVSVGWIFSSFAKEVWSDPYTVGVAREESERNSQGVRLDWSGIAGSPFNATYTWRDLEVEDEESGMQLLNQGQLTSKEQQQLNRNGELHQVELSYDATFGRGNLLRPALILRQANMEGDAESYQGATVQLTYMLRTPQWSLISNLYAGGRDYQETNPIFGKAMDTEEFGLNASFFWNNLFGYKPLSAFVTAAYGEIESEVSFYDTDVRLLSTGLLYRF